jgi:hypothetical protein
MDKLERLIREVAASMNTDGSPASVDDVPDERLADWAKGLLHTLAGLDDVLLEPAKAPKLAPGCKDNSQEIAHKRDAVRQVELLALLLGQLDKAPIGGLTKSNINILKNSILEQMYRMEAGAAAGYLPSKNIKEHGKQAKESSYAWRTVKEYSVGCAAILMAGGEGEMTACDRIATILNSFNVPTSGGTIKRDWLKDAGDGAFITKNNSGTAGYIVTMWVGSLSADEPADLEDLAVSKRQDLIKRFIPLILRRVCLAWTGEPKKGGKGA